MPITKTDKKKDGLQQYRVRVNFTDANGKYKQIERTVYGKTEAQETERRILADLNAAQAASLPTVEKLYEEYKSFKKGEIRITTIEKANRMLDAYIIPAFGNIRIDRLTIPLLTKWRVEMNQKNLSTRYKNNIFSEFRTMMNYAKKQYRLASNPVSEMGPFRDPNDFEMPQEKLHFYTQEQWQRYAAALYAVAFGTPEHKNERYLRKHGLFIFFCIAYYTGMRKGEINALKWSDIDGTILHVRRSISQKVKGVPFLETPPKNKASYRDLEIPVPLQELLTEHKLRQQRDSRWTEDYRVCGGPGVLSDSGIAYANDDAAAAAGLPHIRVHDFRHSHASLLINEGINIQEIARRLGHSKVEITWNTYSHLYPRESERAMNVLNKVTLNLQPNIADKAAS